MNNKFKYLVLANLVLCPMLLAGTVSAEEATQTSQSIEQEASGVAATTESTIENKEDTVSTTEQDATKNEDTEKDEEKEYDFGLPSGRSDLSKSRAMFSVRGSFLSITDKSLPSADFIDISSHNGTISVAEFKKIKSYGVTGVVVKLTEGTGYINPLAASQVTNALSAGLKVSVYHYSWFMSEAAAINEADYFANYAAKLGLPKDTLMVNDIEDNQLKMSKANHTHNSQIFEQRLAQRGFRNTTHYIGYHWVAENKISPSGLGYANTWVAAYPYTPSAQQYTEFGAWQWASTLTFPGVGGNFDISSDYSGKYTLTGGSTPVTPGPYIADGRYVTVTRDNFDIYSNFNWSIKGNSSSLMGKTFQARGRYEHGNGQVYFTLYDGDGNWQGYINAAGVTSASGPQGIYNSDGRYVEITKSHQPIYNGFGWDEKDTTTKHVGKVYKATGRYEHINGSTYYSIYDDKGTWMGYVDARNTGKVSPQGSYISDGRYIQIVKANQSIYSNFNWNVKSSTNDVMNKMYQARGRYEHHNGRTYYTIYDRDGSWQGYVDSESTKEISEAHGGYISDGSTIKITNGNYSIYNGFNWSVKDHTRNHVGKVYKASGRYEHFNGSTYYSLYNDNGQWMGYLNANATTKVNPNTQGPYISDGRYITIDKANKNIYQGFNWTIKNNTSNFMNKTYQARGRYDHSNGKSYFTIYDSKNNWQGYVEAGDVSIAAGAHGAYVPDGRKVKMINPYYTVYSNFAWKHKEKAAKYMQGTYEARARYDHYNGDTYYTLYTLDGHWIGYINANATQTVK
ncbi:GH25 family lysozyme [Vagococcus silagei]